METTSSRPRRAPDLDSHGRRAAILAALIAACIVSTAAHFTHNYVEIAHYPQSSLISNAAVRLAIIIAWPWLTAAGLLGYRLYSRRRYVAAYPLLALYSLLGISTLGHFAFGSPHIPPFWYATIFTDGLLGFAIFAFAHWSAVTAPRAAVRRGATV